MNKGEIKQTDIGPVCLFDGYMVTVEEAGRILGVSRQTVRREFGDVVIKTTSGLYATAKGSSLTTFIPFNALRTKAKAIPAKEDTGIHAMLTSFLEQADGRIGEEAIRAYKESPQFTADKKRALQETIDEMRPEIANRLEKKLRLEAEAELLPRIRKQVESELLKRERTAAVKWDHQNLLDAFFP